MHSCPERDSNLAQYFISLLEKITLLHLMQEMLGLSTGLWPAYPLMPIVCILQDVLSKFSTCSGCLWTVTVSFKVYTADFPEKVVYRCDFQ